MRVVRDHMAYKVLRTRRLTPYQAQYFCHSAQRRHASADYRLGGQPPLWLAKVIYRLMVAWFVLVSLVVAVLLLALLALSVWLAVVIFAACFPAA